MIEQQIIYKTNCAILVEIDGSDGLPKVPLDLDVVRYYFGGLAQDRADKSVRSKSSIDAYINAIKYLYTYREAEMENLWRRTLVSFPMDLRKWLPIRSIMGT